MKATKIQYIKALPQKDVTGRTEIAGEPVTRAAEKGGQRDKQESMTPEPARAIRRGMAYANSEIRGDERDQVIGECRRWLADDESEQVDRRRHATHILQTDWIAG